MDTTRLARWGAIFLLSAGLTACSRDSGTGVPPDDTDSGSPGPDAGPDAVAEAGPDVVTTPDAGPDGSSGPDGGLDAGMAVMSTIAAMQNPGAANHPMSRTNITDNEMLVALTPRIFISGPSSTGNCLYAVWVGTPAGGDYSGIEVDESLPAAANPDGGTGDCFASSVVGLLPANTMIGDTIMGLAGEFEEFCPTGMTCPAGAASEFHVSMGHGGMFNVTGHGGTVPAPTTVMVTDVNGTGATVAPRDLALEGSLVKISGAILREAPNSANHNVMRVSQGTGTATMQVLVKSYSGVTCQRTQLGTTPLGTNIGDITGVLYFQFGAWTIQPRQASDMAGVVCPTDGGVGGG